MHYINTVKFWLVSVLLLSILSACDMGQVPSGCGDTDYRCIAKQDAYNAGIPMYTFETQIEAESDFNPDAVSPAGAIGIAQIMPGTAKDWNVDPHDPIASLQAAAQHMAAYNATYHDYAKALGCYNAGCGRVDWAKNNCSYWLNCMPLETQRYVNIIMGY